MSSNFEQALSTARQFRDERDWSQFHNPKDLVVSIAIEAGELLETFQWSGKDLERPSRRDETVSELADVLIYCIYLADVLGVDIPSIIESKINANTGHYPVELARGTARKYTEL